MELALGCDVSVRVRSSKSLQRKGMVGPPKNSSSTVNEADEVAHLHDFYAGTIDVTPKS